MRMHYIYLSINFLFYNLSKAVLKTVKMDQRYKRIQIQKNYKKYKIKQFQNRYYNIDYHILTYL